MFNMKLLGGKRLERKLRSLGAKLAGQAQIQAMRVAMEPVRIAIIAKTPVRSGRLKSNFKISSRKGNKGFSTSINSGTRKQLRIKANATGYYPSAIEFGTRRMAARPFMRNTFGRMRTQTLNIYTRELKQTIRAATRGLL